MPYTGTIHHSAAFEPSAGFSTLIVCAAVCCKWQCVRRTCCTQKEAYPPWKAVPLREGVLEISKLRHPRPVSLMGRAKHSKNLEKLIYFLCSTPAYSRQATHESCQYQLMAAIQTHQEYKMAAPTDECMVHTQVYNEAKATNTVILSSNNSHTCQW
jgi:hypothetical protein